MVSERDMTGAKYVLQANRNDRMFTILFLIAIILILFGTYYLSEVANLHSLAFRENQ